MRVNIVAAEKSASEKVRGELAAFVMANDSALKGAMNKAHLSAPSDESETIALRRRTVLKDAQLQNPLTKLDLDLMRGTAAYIQDTQVKSTFLRLLGSLTKYL